MARGGLKAADLMAEIRETRSALPKVPAPALAELRALCELNDKERRSNRAGRSTAFKLLASWGVPSMSHETLNRVCREMLGRKSYAQK